MSASKDAILNAIRSANLAEAPRPSLDQAWTTYPDRVLQFMETIAAVGGQAFRVRDAAAANEQLRQLPTYADARKIVSQVPGIGSPNVDLTAVESPHDLADVDVAIMPGHFGVAENGAIWITNQNVRHRVIYYLCQHLVLVINSADIVDHMHAAYARLQASGEAGQPAFAAPLFGAFISGPSKTSDIEQALVIGAHGPLTLTVLLIGE